MTFDSQFQAFSKSGNPNSDGNTITLKNSDKWMTQAKILDGKQVTAADTASWFGKFMSKSITLDQYKIFIEDLAQYKGIPSEQIMEALTNCGPPQDQEEPPGGGGGSPSPMEDPQKPPALPDDPTSPTQNPDGQVPPATGGVKPPGGSTQEPSDSPQPPPNETKFAQQFQLFAKLDPDSDGTKITLQSSDKWMKQANVLDEKKITSEVTETWFGKFKAKSITLEQYKSFVRDIAKYTGVPGRDIFTALTNSGPPIADNEEENATGDFCANCLYGCILM